jgi:hypothetical protein
MCTVIDQSTKSTCAWKSANTSETHASRFEVPRRRISDPEVHHRSRSTKVSTRSHACIARERRVNRYYDPTTDQFLSVDPALSVTLQPYAVEGNDPLNQLDPLGLESVDQFLHWCASNAKTRSYCAGLEKEQKTPLLSGLNTVANDAGSVQAGADTAELVCIGAGFDPFCEVAAGAVSEGAGIVSTVSLCAGAAVEAVNHDPDTDLSQCLESAGLEILTGGALGKIASEKIGDALGAGIDLADKALSYVF